MDITSIAVSCSGSRKESRTNSNRLKFLTIPLPLLRHRLAPQQTMPPLQPHQVLALARPLRKNEITPGPVLMLQTQRNVKSEPRQLFLNLDHNTHPNKQPYKHKHRFQFQANLHSRTFTRVAKTLLGIFKISRFTAMRKKSHGKVALRASGHTVPF